MVNMVQKKIHFYSYEKDWGCCNSWEETKEKIEKGEIHIYTTQMGLLSTELIERGYRIFVHESETDFYEIVLGRGNERTEKAIRPAHNLFKMWQAGAFAKK